MKKNSLEISILKTSAYFQQFDFPLTLDELLKFLHSQKTTRSKLKSVIEKMPQIKRSGEYYFLDNNKNLVDQRLKRKKYSFEYYKTARRFGKILSCIPTIKFIGISGSLSMNNCKKKDDIDLFFITSKNSLWVSRLIVTVLLLLLRKKRSKNKKNSQGTICTNMWMSEKNLTLSKQNVYTAHEITQLKRLVDKKCTYNSFLRKNKWVYNFLPNFTKPGKTTKKTIQEEIMSTLILPIDLLAFYIQVFYMRKSRHGEVVTRNLAMFHPDDCNKKVLTKYSSISKNILRQIDDPEFASKNSMKEPYFSLNVITPGS